MFLGLPPTFQRLCFLEFCSTRSPDHFLCPPGAKDLPTWSQETHHCFLSGEAVRGASGQAASFVSDQGEGLRTPTLFTLIPRSGLQSLFLFTHFAITRAQKG